jgi:hypothetical protein
MERTKEKIDEERARMRNIEQIKGEKKIVEI